ncbi:hypothetical protein Plec18170_009356 [Paecilomyces lecythidis]
MTPHQHRKSRNTNIPNNFIQNWQSPGAEGGRYTAPSTTTTTISSTSSQPTAASIDPSNNVDSSAFSSNGQAPAFNMPLSGSPKTSLVPMTMEWETGIADPLRLNDEGHQQELSSMAEWPKDISNYLFDWSSLDLGHNTINPPGIGDLDVSPTAVGQTTMLETQDRNTDLAEASVPAASAGGCQCRTHLMLQVPEVHEAIQAKPHPQLDRIFKVTGNVLGACRDLIICTTCQVSYADLVCVVAVLQQTGTCFDKIANGEMTTSTIKVCVGQYQIPIANEAKLRHMLVMDLVAQANCLLSLLQNRGQSLVQGSAQDRLTQINIDYMQEVVKNFEHTLRSIAGSLETSRSDS